MTLVTTSQQEAETQELLASFHGSLRDLRRAIEHLREQVAAGQEEDLSAVTKALSPAEALIRNCRKLEMSLAEERYRSLGIAQGGYAVDLDRARSEIGGRLARLRTALGATDVSE